MPTVPADRLLFLDLRQDEPDGAVAVLEGCALALETAATVEDAEARLSAGGFRCLVVALEEGPGAEESARRFGDLLLRLREHAAIECPIIATGPRCIDLAVRSVKAGAWHFIPWEELGSRLIREVEDCENARQTDSQRHLYRETTFFHLLQAISSTIQIEQLINLVLDSSMELLRAQAGSILMLGESGLEPSMSAIRLPESDRLPDPYLGIEPKDLLVLFRPDETGREPGKAETRACSLETGRIIAAAMTLEQGARGLLLLRKGRPDGPSFTQREIDLAEKLSVEASKAISNSLLIERTRELLYKDDLTEAFNRRFLEQKVQEELKERVNEDQPLSLIFLDLDDLKEVNSTHGHIMGSKAIQELSRRMILAVRGVDHVVRYGGDEFCIILPDTEKDAARQVAARLKRIIGEAPFLVGEKTPVRLTASLGVATFPEDASTLVDLIRKADGAMQTAKSMGKDSVAVSKA